MSIEFENITRSAKLIDTRIEINIITLNLTRRVRFPIRDEPKFINIVFQIDHSQEFYKMIEKISIKIRSTVNMISI